MNSGDEPVDDGIVDRAEHLVYEIERAAASEDFEAVLDHVDGVLELYAEFPSTVWDAVVILTRSREPSVRIAMATRGIPQVHNQINPFLAKKLTGWLLEDSNPAVVQAMAASVSNQEAA